MTDKRLIDANALYEDVSRMGLTRRMGAHSEGTWEYRYFNHDDVYDNQIDRPVVGWMPLPEKLKKEGVA